MKKANWKPVFQFDKKQLSDLRDAFEIFDHDGTGLIPAKYLRIILRAFGLNADKNEIELLTKYVGKDYEDRLTYDDFTAILQKIISTVPPSDFLVKAFQLYDDNKEGRITKHDLERVATLLGEHLSEEDIHDMITNATDNESATEVHLEDFLKMLQKPFDPKLI